MSPLTSLLCGVLLLSACGQKELEAENLADAEAGGAVSALDEAPEAGEAVLPGDPAAPLDEATEAPAWDPSPAQERVYKLLSVRDPAPSCQEVEALTETPVETLLWLVDNAAMPPWVGLRSADCLVSGHPTEIEPQATDWMESEGSRGLALLLCDHLDAMDPDLASRLALAGLAGPYAEDVSARLLLSQRDALRALAQ